MFATELDELRTWPTDRLRASRDEATREERRWQMRRIAIDRVLDERGATDTRDTVEWVAARDGVRTQTARTEVEVARALDSLPVIAAAAEAGELSMEQLGSLVQLATPETDAAWAARGRQAAPSDLERLVRRQRIVSPEEMAARREARELRWWRKGKMLRLTGAIPDIDGALVEAVLEHMVGAMRPRKGQPWDTRAHRGADALVALCRAAKNGAQADGNVGGTWRAPKRGWKPSVVIHMGSDAQPTVNGMPIAVETVQTLIDEGARVREVHNDDPLAPTHGDRIPAALREYLRARDPLCRVPGCTRKVGLDAHHLRPRSWGGRTDKHSVAMICPYHHRQAVPHGPWVLEGDPEQPDGLGWHRIDRPDHGGVAARAGPAA